MKKVLILSPLGGTENGADIAMNHQMSYLNQLGYDIHLITTAPNTSTFSEFLKQNRIKHYLLDYTWWRDDSLQSSQDAIRNVKAISDIATIIIQEKIDIAVTNTANIPQLAFAAAFCDIPHLWLVHEFPEGEFAYTLEKYDFISSFSNEILTASDVLAEEITKLSYNIPVNYFYPFTDVSDIVLASSSNTPRIVSVNTVNGKRKNTDELIRIYEQLKLSFPSLELVITGSIIDKAYYDELKKYISDHHIQDVSFLDDYTANWGNVSSSDIFVNTSAMETFSLTIIESLKLGVTTVVADNYAAKSMLSLGYLSPEDVYELGNITDAVEKISVKLNHFDLAKQHTTLLQKKVLREQSLEKITQSLVTAIEKYNENPRKELRYFKQQTIAVGEELNVRMQVIDEDRQVLEERLEIINQQGEVLRERLELIVKKDELLDEERNLNMGKDKLLVEHLSIIEEQQEKLAMIEQSIWFKIGKKLRLL